MTQEEIGTSQPKQRETPPYLLPGNPAGKIGPHLVSTLKDANNHPLRDHPASTVIFCPLVEVAFGRVVNVHAVTNSQQEAVNDAVFELNMEVFSINNSRSTYSPSLHHTIHRSNKGKRRATTIT